jgi:threonine dehydratase
VTATLEVETLERPQTIGNAELQPLYGGEIGATQAEVWNRGGEAFDLVADAIDETIDVELLSKGGLPISSQEDKPPAWSKMPELYHKGIKVTSLEAEDSKWSHIRRFVKDETQQSISAFKIRGAFVAGWHAIRGRTNLKRVVTASAGNHGQGVAGFAQWANEEAPLDTELEAVVYCAETASSVKVGAIAARGATVVNKGIPNLETADQEGRAQVKADNTKAEGSAHFVPAFDNEYVMAGQSLQLAEVVDQLRSAGANLLEQPLVLRVGGGGFGMACGNAVLMQKLVQAGALHPDSCVIAVQMENCDSMVRAMQRIDEGKADMNDLFFDEDGQKDFDPSADGTAVERVGDLNMPLTYYLRSLGRLHLDVVPKRLVGLAMRASAVRGRTLEPAGALPGASFYQYENAYATEFIGNPGGQTPYIDVCVASGGNVTTETAEEFWQAYLTAEQGIGRHTMTAASGLTYEHRTGLVEPTAR